MKKLLLTAALVVAFLLAGATSIEGRPGSAAEALEWMGLL